VRRRLIIATMLVLGGTSLAFAAGAAGDQPHAQLKGFDCQHALDPPDRGVAVRAVMRPLAGTQRLELKFDLLVSHAGSAAVPVRSGDLGVWSEPKNPTLGQLSGDVWNFQKTVVDLDAPATYQFRVSFRWFGSGDRVIGSAVRYSERCHQRELRPDLQVMAPIAVTAIASRPNRDLYTATIRNAGATAAGPFSVAFVPGGSSAAPSPQTIQRLGPDKERSVSFVGPLCATADPSDPPEIIADSAAQVDDLNRSNNSLAATCPAPGGT
jgi:CARDB